MRRLGYARQRHRAFLQTERSVIERLNDAAARQISPS